MDYFNELLESYTKLKKRTFKLTFLNEADSKPKPKKKEEKKEEDAHADPTAAKAFWDAADPERVPANFQNATATEAPYAYVKDGVTLATGGPLGTGYAKGTSWDDLYANSRKMAVKLINYFDQEGMEQEANDEQFVQDTLAKIGGYFELYGKVKPTAKTIKDMQETRSYAEDFCRVHANTQKSNGGLRTFCQRIDRYIGGMEKMGFEYKLANAEAFSVVDQDLGTTKKVPLSAGTIEQVTASHKFLVSFLRESNKDKCEQVTKRIGTSKGNSLVLFGSEATEGVVIQKNQLQDMALKKIEKDCGISYEDLGKIVGDGFSQKEKNAIKGTMFEGIMAFSTRMAAAQQLGGSAGKDAKKTAISGLSKIIKEKKGVLESIFNDINHDAARDLSSEFAHQIQEETTEMLSSLPKLREGLEREIRSTKGIVGFMEAEDINETGKVVKTGGREDLEFVYSDKDKAQSKATAIGSSVVEKEGKFTVGVGLKRLKAIKGAKFGEINSESRLVGLILDEVDDKNIEPGFVDSMATTQFGNKTSPARQKALYSYTNTLESKIAKNTKNFTNDKTYINPEGKIKSQTPESVLKSVAGNITGLLSVPQLESSLLFAALFDKNEGGENILKKFEGEEGSENRERARETIARASRFSQLKKDIESCTDGTCPAKDYLMKSILICGSNTRDMGQVIIADDGEALVVKHNEVFKILAKANNNGNLNYSFKEGGSSVTVTDSKTGVSVRYGQEGTNAGTNRRDTRSVVVVPSSTLKNKKVSGDISSVTNENINFSEYIKGHQALLEKFLGKPFNNGVV